MSHKLLFIKYIVRTMKSLLHLVLVLVIAGVLHDLQQTTTRLLGSKDNSLVHSHGNNAGGNSVGVLMTGVSAARKRSQTRSKLIFQITIDASKPKRKMDRKTKGKIRAKRRRTMVNHRHHYHTLRKQYLKQLKGGLKHGNHYHKPRLNNGLWRNCCPRKPFERKDVTWKKRRYDQRKPSRRRQSSTRRHRPFRRNSRRSKQNRRQSHRSGKTPIRRNNRHRRPATTRRNQWRRTKKLPQKHSSGRTARKGNQKKTRRGRKTGKSETVFEMKEYGNREDKKSRRTRPNRHVYY